MATGSRKMVDDFHHAASAEDARNIFRRALHHHSPMLFPMGPTCVKLDNLLKAATTDAACGSARLWCESCGYTLQGVVHTFGMYVTAYATNSLRRINPQGYSLRSWFERHFDRYNGPQIAHIPPLLVVAIEVRDMILDTRLRFTTYDGTQSRELRLCGMIYHSWSARHFTSMVVDEDGTCWYHDGMTTRRNCLMSGNIAACDSVVLCDLIRSPMEQ
ncbi:hypothetical protein R3P38DRAFT_2878161 [Favolaschia claudopus]|uniref:Uncharacterized protein n=1 Tax=Favolaschia claudopus TaxID=2862362 RepID=A0AAW0CY96_9AGAR